MKFIATAKGYFNDSIVNVGEEFEADANFSAKWAVKAKDHEPEKPATDKKLAEDAKEGLQGKKTAKKKAKKKAAKKTAKKE